MNVLSVFDGMSCGQIALERAGIKVEKYFASEIDKYAIQVARKNYPNTRPLGSIEYWRSWVLPKIDLLIGGSPCQGFSNAGKGLNFEDPRSKLFFTYVDILKDLKEKNPDLQFLLENVKMKKEWQKIISDLLGVEPVKINSALVSAQNRERLYWANWKIEQPEDKGIFLKDIIEDGVVDRDKSYVVGANYHKGGTLKNYFEDGKRQLVFGATFNRNDGLGKEIDKSLPVLASDWRGLNRNQNQTAIVQGAALRNQVTKNGTEAQLNVRKDEKSNCVVPTYTAKLNGLVQVGMAGDIKGFDVVRRIYSAEGKSPTLTDMQGGHRQPKIATDELHYRKLTVLECERLQTVPEGYTEGVSNTQRYKMLGNGWTVDVIVWILNSNPNLM